MKAGDSLAHNTQSKGLNEPRRAPRRGYNHHLNRPSRRHPILTADRLRIKGASERENRGSREAAYDELTPRRRRGENHESTAALLSAAADTSTLQTRTGNYCDREKHAGGGRMQPTTAHHAYE